MHRLKNCFKNNYKRNSGKLSFLRQSASIINWQVKKTCLQANKQRTNPQVLSQRLIEKESCSSLPLDLGKNWLFGEKWDRMYCFMCLISVILIVLIIMAYQYNFIMADHCNRIDYVFHRAILSLNPAHAPCYLSNATKLFIFVKNNHRSC